MIKLKENEKFITKKGKLLIIFLLFFSFIFLNFFNLSIASGTSMLPTIPDKSISLILNLKIFPKTLKEKLIKRDKIIVVKEKNIDNELIIKRVAGLPGDCIKIQDDKLFINNKIYKQHWVFRYYNINYCLSDNQYFILGDNQDVSLDSKDFGPITQDEIIGIDLVNINMKNNTLFTLLKNKAQQNMHKKQQK